MKKIQKRKMSKIRDNNSDHMASYIEFERLVLNILKEEENAKELVKELLEEYAAKHAEGISRV